MSQNLLVRQNSFLDGTTKVNIDNPIPITTSHPIFKLQPLHEIHLTLGQRLKIECQGDGDNIGYQWFKDEVLLKAETANYLIRDKISQFDLGKYDVRIIDKWGRWTSSTCYVIFEQLQTNNTYQSSYNNYQSANYLYSNQTQMQNAFQPIQPQNQMYNYSSGNVTQPMYQHAQMDNYTLQNVAQPVYPLNVVQPMHPQNPIYNYSSQNFTQPIYPQNQIQNNTSQNFTGSMFPQNQFPNNIPQNFTQPIYPQNRIQNNTSQNFTQISRLPQNQIQNNIPQNFTQPIYPQNQIQNNTDSQNFTQSTFPQNQIQNYSSQTFTQPENSQTQMPLHSMTSQPLPDKNYLTTNNFNPAHDQSQLDQSTISNNQNAANYILAVQNTGYNDAYLNDFSEEERQLKEEGLLPPKLDSNTIKPSKIFLKQLSLAQKLAAVGLSIDYLSEIPEEYRPRFTKQPISQTLRSKDSVRLDCTAEDTNEYQWYKDGVAIEDATNNYYLISYAQHSDEGFYSCVIRNLYTFISSDIIKIDIND